MKGLCILGSTGSVGQNTLRVVRSLPDRFRVVALCAGKNLDLLADQVQGFGPSVASVATEACVEPFRQQLRARNYSRPVKIVAGTDGQVEASTHSEVDFVVSASHGVTGLVATYEAIRAGKHVGLANKETLVAAGEVPVALTTYNSNVEPLKRKGAPIDFVPVQPVVARPQGIGVARNAPHPHAALLFADLVLSPEGQKLFESMGRVPASTRVKSRLNDFPFILIEPATVLDEAPKWEKVWNGFFLTR